MYWFTADEHYLHHNILKYCSRPFSSITEMDEEIIRRHNEVVKKEDRVIHVGDFTLLSNRKEVELKYVKRLNGSHIFLSGSHDKWLQGVAPHIWERKIEDIYIVCCHYMMYKWPRSHYGSWQLFGHSHGRIQTTFGKQYDVGVDNNNFYPVSFNQLIEIMKKRPENHDKLY